MSHVAQAGLHSTVAKDDPNPHPSLPHAWLTGSTADSGSGSAGDGQLGRLSTSRATAAALNCLLPKDQEPAVKREISIYLNLAGLTTTSKTDPEVCL